jgi:uncharacterized protein YbjT (DUF2867 family)
MKILITGTTGYIAKRLIPVLLSQKHELVCCVRDLDRIPKDYIDHPQVQFLEIDFLSDKINDLLDNDIKAAYYLIHSMSSNNSNFDELEKTCALNFKRLVEKTNIEQVLYLSGITNDEELSKHLSSRKQVEHTLASEKYALTTLKAGIIVGSGSASFEIIRDLTEKLPVMVTPKWLNTKTQPIGIRNVIEFLQKSLLKKELYNISFDIYGPDILTYKKMLLIFARKRKLKRTILTVPVMTPKLSSYWLYFVTSTSYRLAISLVESMKVEVVAKKNNVAKLLDIQPISYEKAVESAFDAIAQNILISSWKDSVISGNMSKKVSKHINVPHFGCLKDIKISSFESRKKTLNKIWALGGKNGWYRYTILWKIRGYIDKLVGGIGLRRGRTHPTKLQTGDVLDFWRVLYASKKEGRLLLYAEMKLPGEAWLEFRIVKNKLYQRAVFRPKGLWGRLYWYAVLPFHSLIFNGLIKSITRP